MRTAYTTKLGKTIIGDCTQVLQTLEDNSIDLIITSPPFALEGRKKSYGNLEGQNYIDWLANIGRLAYPKLKDTGSFVIDLGAIYNRGMPTFSLYQFRVLIEFCDNLKYHLAQPFYWHNTSALPSPIEWVNKKKLRAKNSVNTIWWFSKTPNPKANIMNVLVPYSKRMEQFISHPEEFVKDENTVRPSGHIMNKGSWAKNNGGAIPPNLLQFSNSGSNGKYLRYCKACNISGHPARFPIDIPNFFINFLTQTDDLVVDIFAGSNTTGESAENLNRRWLSVELLDEYAAASSFRFCENENQARVTYTAILNGNTINF